MPRHGARGADLPSECGGLPIDPSCDPSRRRSASRDSWSSATGRRSGRQTRPRSASPAFRAMEWPDNRLAEGYDQLVRLHLMTAEPPAPPVSSPLQTALLRKYWELTERWRFDAVERAVESTRRLGEPGLRRGELIRAVERSLGVSRAAIPRKTLSNCSHL
jgi:hypothetical protein